MATLRVGWQNLKVERVVNLPKIMIVDDDRTTVQLLQMLLEMDGFEIAVAPRGADVLPLAQEFQPDLFLMDYHLSDMEGVDVVIQLRADAAFANTPIVVASGLNVEAEVIEAGANRFLVKPLEPADLPILFNELLTG